MSTAQDDSEREEGSAGAVYRPPVDTPSPVTGGLGAAELRTAAYVFGGWLFGASILAGLALSLDLGSALGHFGMESGLAWMVAIGAFRQQGASVAASAAVVAIVTLQHRRVKAGVALPRTRDLWPILSIAPFAALLSACLMTAISVFNASTMYGVSVGTSWRGIAEHQRPTDFPVGVGTAAVLACGVGLIARLARRLAEKRRSLFVRIVVGLLFLKAGVGAVNFTITLIWTGNDDSRPLIDYPRGDVSPD